MTIGFLDERYGPTTRIGLFRFVFRKCERFYAFSDKDPIFNPDELETYKFFDEEDNENVLPLSSTSCNSQKGRLNDIPATLIQKQLALQLMLTRDKKEIEYQ